MKWLLKPGRHLCPPVHGWAAKDLAAMQPALPWKQGTRGSGRKKLQFGKAKGTLPIANSQAAVSCSKILYWTDGSASELPLSESTLKAARGNPFQLLRLFRSLSGQG
jgi:hypothetical protein